MSKRNDRICPIFVSPPMPAVTEPSPQGATSLPRTGRNVKSWSLLSFHPVKIDTSRPVGSKRSQLSGGAKTKQQAGGAQPERVIIP